MVASINFDEVVIDVSEFFDEIISGYTQFGHFAATLAQDIPSLQPKIIEQRCEELYRERIKLSHLDDKLLEILHLAGDELSNDSLLSKYRSAFNQATKACENVKNKLTEVKESLQHSGQKH